MDGPDNSIMDGSGNYLLSLTENVINVLLDDQQFVADCKTDLDEIMKDGKFDFKDMPQVISLVVSIYTKYDKLDINEEDIESLYLDAWKFGVKALAVYRDSCKVAQPLAVEAPESTSSIVSAAEAVISSIGSPQRERLPRSRSSKTFEFRVADCKGFVTVGEYDDGRPGEIFIRVSKQGSTLAGIMDAFAMAISHGLQYGVPLDAYVRAFVGMRFEPAGITDDPELRIASSLIDYLFRRLSIEYLDAEQRAQMNIFTTGERMQPTLPGIEEATAGTEQGIDIKPDPPSGDGVANTEELRTFIRIDAPFCMQCGIQMGRSGSCYTCQSCGNTSGCS